MHIRPLERADGDSCEAIVRALPDWFGIEEGIAEARDYLDAQPGLVAGDDGRILGFLTFAGEFPESVEITWMAVAADAHRRGVGCALVEALTEVLRQRGVRLLLVRTLADSHPSPKYAATRAFYRAMGFHPLTVLPEHWDAANPCLFMVRTV
jgi:ribosomal protein S18 acetylase RimI-like enzyme